MKVERFFSLKSAKQNVVDWMLVAICMLKTMPLLKHQHRVTARQIYRRRVYVLSALTTTSAVDVMQLVDQYFDRTGLVWENVISVCTDGAPAMLGSRSGFVQLARKENPDIESVHCFIHREALA
ncbi:hypothetical protein EB796_012944 [Bugula neritina]|uniref:Uncharacterized protein n=1 Tax=Bugula neritina TaxID=10212 RepID=A0A7J7JQW4_BUGNE|nr:hypothetical protein EB796_012944 [Bugula neritina]